MLNRFLFLRWTTNFAVDKAASNPTWKILLLARFPVPWYLDNSINWFVLAVFFFSLFPVKPWSSFPFLDRFWMVPVNEPEELFSAFQKRFKKACFLQHQLPTMKPEQLKTMVRRFINLALFLQFSCLCTVGNLNVPSLYIFKLTKEHKHAWVLWL